MNATYRCGGCDKDGDFTVRSQGDKVAVICSCGRCAVADDLDAAWKAISSKVEAEALPAPTLSSARQIPCEEDRTNHSWSLSAKAGYMACGFCGLEVKDDHS
jgi:hypothetical protein